MRILVTALLSLAATAHGEDPTLPSWFTEPTNSKVISSETSGATVSLTFESDLSPSNIASLFEVRLAHNKIDYRSGFNGIGTTIRAIDGDQLCVARISDLEPGSRVVLGCSSHLDPKPTFEIPAPKNPLTPERLALLAKAGAHFVEYQIDGSGDVSITMQNSRGGTEQHLVRLPVRESFFAARGFFAYMSAQKQGQQGEITVTLLIDGSVVQSAAASGPFSIATASGRITN